MKTGIELIAEERQEQIEKHGFTPERDKYYTDSELESAARYLLTGMSQDYPRRWAEKYKHQLDIKTHVEKLVVAGALLAAEIDRINLFGGNYIEYKNTSNDFKLATFIQTECAKSCDNNTLRPALGILQLDIEDLIKKFNNTL